MYYNEDSTFHIVFPCGDKKKLSVVEICASLQYELSEYAVASRQSFGNPMDAHIYAKELAKKHNLLYTPDKSLIGPEANYLD